LKQRITVEQLQELTEEQQQRLREWWKREFGDVFYITDYKNNKEAQLQVLDRSWQLIVKEYRKEFLPLLSIGQMIALIESKDDCINITKLLTDIDHKSLWGWEVVLRHLRNRNDDIELCEVLWQTVKEIL
jgi:hypothetical protein